MAASLSLPPETSGAAACQWHFNASATSVAERSDQSTVQRPPCSTSIPRRQSAVASPPSSKMARIHSFWPKAPRSKAFHHGSPRSAANTGSCSTSTSGSRRRTVLRTQGVPGGHPGKTCAFPADVSHPHGSRMTSDVWDVASHFSGIAGGDLACGSRWRFVACRDSCRDCAGRCTRCRCLAGAAVPILALSPQSHRFCLSSFRVWPNPGAHR